VTDGKSRRQLVLYELNEQKNESSSDKHVAVGSGSDEVGDEGNEGLDKLVRRFGFGGRGKGREVRVSSRVFEKREKKGKGLTFILHQLHDHRPEQAHTDPVVRTGVDGTDDLGVGAEDQRKRTTKEEGNKRSALSSIVRISHRHVSSANRELERRESLCRQSLRG